MGQLGDAMHNIGTANPAYGSPYDCTGLLTAALRSLRCRIPDRYNPQLNTSSIRSGTTGLFVPVNDRRAIQEDDILIIQNRNGGWHAGVIEDYNPATGQGHFRGIQTTGGYQDGVRFGPGTPYWTGDFQIYREICIPRPGPGIPFSPATIIMNAIINAQGSFTAAQLADRPLGMGDPLVLDLDGNGTQTTNVKAGAFFDHDGNGFAEQTAWVDPNDGLLAMDRNGNGEIDNGKELFGDQTILKNGTRASNGFQALADFDDNHDGIIDANDAAYSPLRVWQDTNGDGYSDPEELHTLSELGIKSINLSSTPQNTTDSQKGVKSALGSCSAVFSTHRVSRMS